MTPKRLTGITAAAAIAAGVLGAGLALTLCRGLSASPRALATPSAKTSFAYYETVARRFAGGQPQGYGSMMRTGGYGSMMGGAGYSWTMSQSGYTRMMGGANAPGWMTGGSLPASMMEGRHDPSKVMGKLFANAPGARVSKAQAARLATVSPLAPPSTTAAIPSCSPARASTSRWWPAPPCRPRTSGRPA